MSIVVGYVFLFLTYAYHDQHALTIIDRNCVTVTYLHSLLTFINMIMNNEQVLLTKDCPFRSWMLAMLCQMVNHNYQRFG